MNIRYSKSVMRLSFSCLLLVLSVAPFISSAAVSGITWQEVQPKGDANGNWYRTATDDTGTIVVAAENPGRLYVSSDGGVTWTERQPAGNVNTAWRAMDVSDDGHLIIVAVEGGRMYRSTTSGAVWVETQPAGAANRDWYSVSMSDDGQTVFATYYGGRVYRSGNSGEMWSEIQPNGAVVHNWYDVETVGDGSRVIAVHYFSGSAANGRVYISENSGTSWVERMPHGAGNFLWWNASLSTLGDVAYAAKESSDITYRTTNLGSSWTQVLFSSSSASQQITHSDSGEFAFSTPSTYGRLYYSEDNGLSWTETQPTGNQSRQWNQSDVSGDGTKVFNGYFGGRFYRGVVNEAVDFSVVVDGEGTEEYPYEIDSFETLEALDELGLAVGDTTGLYFALTDDIEYENDLVGINFGGFFDGRGHTINNLSGRPVFNNMVSAEVKDLHITNAAISISSAFTDIGLLARETNDTAISGVTVEGSITMTGNDCTQVGGLVGSINNSDISESAAMVDIDGDSCNQVGGLVGYSLDSIITQSYATGTVVGDEVVGGLVGEVENLIVNDTYARVTVTGGESIGGLIGIIKNATVARSYSTGDVASDDEIVGGLIGDIRTGGKVLASFSAASSVTGAGVVGGLFGGHIEEEYYAQNNAWVKIPSVNAIGMFTSSCNGTAALAFLADCDSELLSYDLDSVSQLKSPNQLTHPVYLEFEPPIMSAVAPWDFTDDIDWKIDTSTSGNNDGFPYLSWQEYPQPEPEEEEEEVDQPSRSSGGGTRNTVRSALLVTPPIVTPTTQSVDILTLVLKNRALFEAAEAAGVTLSPMIKDILSGGGAATGMTVRDLTVGMEGADVKALQTLLLAQGYVISAGATGYFAGQTKSALAAYQFAKGIAPAVGYFGVVTRAQMKEFGIQGLWW